MTNDRYKIRRVETYGPRAGLVIEWQTYNTLHECDCDGGWCQTYATKREAQAGVDYLNATNEEKRELDRRWMGLDEE
jgi:hypothetical protein